MKALSNFLLSLIVLAGVASAVTAGCGSPASKDSGSDAGLQTGDDSGGRFFGDDASSGTGYGGDGNVILGALAITPTSSTVSITNGTGGQPVQFAATVGGTATGVAWSVD